MPQEYLEAAVARGKVSLLPQEVKNLLALNSLQARWASIDPVSPVMGFRVYHNTQPMRSSMRYVCVKAEDAYELSSWLDAVHRWEQWYGPRL